MKTLRDFKVGDVVSVPTTNVIAVVTWQRPVYRATMVRIRDAAGAYGEPVTLDDTTEAQRSL